MLARLTEINKLENKIEIEIEFIKLINFINYRNEHLRIRVGFK